MYELKVHKRTVNRYLKLSDPNPIWNMRGQAVLTGSRTPKTNELSCEAHLAWRSLEDEVVWFSTYTILFLNNGTIAMK